MPWCHQQASVPYWCRACRPILFCIGPHPPLVEWMIPNCSKEPLTNWFDSAKEIRFAISWNQPFSSEMTLVPELVDGLLKLRRRMNSGWTNHSFLLLPSLGNFSTAEGVIWSRRLLDSHVVTSWSLIRSKQLLSAGLFIRRIISYTCTCHWSCIAHQKNVCIGAFLVCECSAEYRLT